MSWRFTDEFSSWKHSHFHGARDPSSLHFQTLPQSTFPSSDGDSREDRIRPLLSSSLRVAGQIFAFSLGRGLVKESSRSTARLRRSSRHRDAPWRSRAIVIIWTKSSFAYGCDGDNLLDSGDGTAGLLGLDGGFVGGFGSKVRRGGPSPFTFL